MNNLGTFDVETKTYVKDDYELTVVVVEGRTQEIRLRKGEPGNCEFSEATIKTVPLAQFESYWVGQKGFMEV